MEYSRGTASWTCCLILTCEGAITSQPPFRVRVEERHHEWKSASERNASTPASQKEAEQAAGEACGGAGGRTRRDRSEASENICALPKQSAVQVDCTRRGNGAPISASKTSSCRQARRSSTRALFRST